MAIVRTTYLELRSLAAFRPSTLAPPDMVVRKEADPELHRFLYASVGGAYHWIDRRAWSDAEWRERLSQPGVEGWVAFQSGAPAGYFELEAQEGDSVEIAYFGLLPGFIGRGLGGYLLTRAVEQAFALKPGVRRVWLHTCTLDHPGALAGYKSRGFSVFKEEESEMTPTLSGPRPDPAVEPVR